MAEETKEFSINWGADNDADTRADDVQFNDIDPIVDTDPVPIDRSILPDDPVEELPWSSEIDAAPTPFLATDGFAAADFDADDHEPFDRTGTHKMGIIGGKGVGKSYLFQAMVYRTFAGRHSGALTYYLERDAMHLFVAQGQTNGAGVLTKAGTARPLNRVGFIKKYQTWQRLPFTSKDAQHWYRLRLPYRTGWLGGKRFALDVEFFDGSGEGFFGVGSVTTADRALWERNYLDARVMVFCLPLWAAFPDSSISEDDWQFREDLIEGFEQVVQNYNKIRRNQPVSSILALTMADDRRSALRTLRDRWISPFIDSPNTYLKQLRKGRGVARYLANARLISEALHEEFASAGDPRINNIPQQLDFDRGRPWIVALSAMEGVRLEELELKYRNPDDPARLREARNAAPTPVHVELPLLLALCEHENALM